MTQAMTKSLVPKDAEIFAVAREAGLLPDNSHPAPETRAARKHSDAVRAFARAALAKWGTPQPVVREPLTDGQIRAMAREHPTEDLCGWSYLMGISDAERHHGIKGGQHGAE